MAAAERYAEGRAGTIAFAVVDEAGRLHGYHGARLARSASLLKPMLLVAYLRGHDVRGRGLTSWERRLLTPMIRRSDNANVPRLIGLVGERRLARLAEAAGMGSFELNMPFWGSSETTPFGQALFFHRIESLLPERHRAYAMRLLETIIPSQRWGVGRVPHAGWRLYFKGGWSTGTGRVDHQVALYAAGSKRLSLALFTQFDPDHEYGKETLRGLAERLLRGLPAPWSRGPSAERVALSRTAVASARSACGTVAIRPTGKELQSFVTGAGSCEGFQLVSAGAQALWSWPDGGESHLVTADYGSATPVDLGDFGSSDPLGPLAGNGETLAYSHGGEVSVVGGPDCPVAADVLAVGGERLAAGAEDTVEIVDPYTCVVERTLHSSGVVAAVALDDELAASLSHGSAGRTWLEWFRISTGERLGKEEVAGATLPSFSLREPWILYRTPRSMRVLATGSGRTRTVWRPASSPLGARLLGRRIAWAENGDGKTFLWALHLPAGD